MKLLVVEDYADTALLLSRILGRIGSVDTAHTVEEAARKAVQRRYDVFVIDIQLKELRTGVDLLRELRRQANYADAPMIACTAYALPGDRDRLLSEGFDGYVAKPFTKDQLLHEVKRHWHAKQRRDEETQGDVSLAR